MNSSSSGLHALLRTDSRIKVVDIGANPIDDAQPPYAPLLSAGRAEIVGFEPNLQALAVLNEKKGEHETYLPYAVGDGARHTLRFCQAPGMTSLLEPNRTVLEMFHGFPQWGNVTGREEIDTVRLDDIPETAHFDYLKIDIQGAELMVFRNATERLKDALIIHTEVEFLPMYEGQPLFSDVDQFLRSQGFMLHKFEPLTSRTLAPMLVDNSIYSGLSQVFWADAVFIRDIIDLSPLSNEQLLKLAVILHDCYRSYDVALRLLMEHDTRTGSQHAGAYMGSISSQAA